MTTQEMMEKGGAVCQQFYTVNEGAAHEIFCSILQFIISFIKN